MGWGIDSGQKVEIVKLHSSWYVHLRSVVAYATRSTITSDQGPGDGSNPCHSCSFELGWDTRFEEVNSCCLKPTPNFSQSEWRALAAQSFSNPRPSTFNRKRHLKNALARVTIEHPLF
ncbi:hypothetical protein TNCV_1028921 [Trichonephila clavipes]|nr:hypothetical protein TNCV_1028921 [Trichonephila clavipes]